MTNGTVKWFNSRKGFGFIVPEDNSKDIFVHYSKITSTDDTPQTLNEGDKVSFDTVEGAKGLEAINVVITEAAPKKEPSHTFNRGGGGGSRFSDRNKPFMGDESKSYGQFDFRVYNKKKKDSGGRDNKGRSKGRK